MKRRSEENTNFTMISNVLIENPKHLGVTPLQFQLIITIMKYRYNNHIPFPSSGTIAREMGVSERTIKRESKRLQLKGYLIRPKGGRRPYWDLSPLFEKLNQLNGAKYDTVAENNIDNSDALLCQNKRLTVPNPAINSDKVVTRRRKKKKEEYKNNKKNKTGNFNSLLEKNKTYYKDKQKNEERRVPPEVKPKKTYIKKLIKKETKNKNDEYFMRIYRKMDTTEKFKLNLEASALVNFGNNKIRFSGRESPELNKYRVQALKLRDQEDNVGVN